jgi:hypothetical protein
MNFRITTLFFGLLLTMLWVFGLMVAHKKSAGDLSFVMGDDFRKAKIDKVLVKRTDGAKTVDAEFRLDGEKWYLQADKQRVQVDGFRVKKIIKAIADARNDETADVSQDKKTYGLDNPKTVVTFNEGDKQWEFFVGNEVGGSAYVTSSDRKDRTFAVGKNTVEPLNFSDANTFRNKRPFNFESTSVIKLFARYQDPKTAKFDELELKKADGARWDFIKPSDIGFTRFESVPEEEPDKDKKKKKDFFSKEKEKAKEPVADTGGVKSLLSNILSIRVDTDDHFEKLGKSLDFYGVEKPGKETTGRIEITSEADDKDAKDAKGKDKDKVKAAPPEILLIGNATKVGDKVYYYARLASDDGVMKIAKTPWLDPVIEAIEKPKSLRTRDVAPFEPKQADVVTIKQNGAEVKFFKQDSAPDFKLPRAFELPAGWQMVVGAEKKKASSAALAALLSQVQGRRGIVEYHDGAKDEAKWGLDKDPPQISVYIDGIEKEKAEEKKKDDKNVEKKEDKLPTLKKDYKPEVTLYIGKIDGDIVHIKRKLKDGTETYFTMKKEFREKAFPSQGIELGYLDTSVPHFDLRNVTSFTLKRVTDKGLETFELAHRGLEGELAWYLKEGNDYKLADSAHVDSIVRRLAPLPVRKWVKKLDNKEGVDKPVVTAIITVKKHEPGASEIKGKDKDGKDITLNAADGVVTLWANCFDMPFVALGYAAAARQIDAGETYTIELGKEMEVDKEKFSYATHSGAKQLLFQTDPHIVKMILKEDLRDRSGVLYTQAELEAMFKGIAAINPTNVFMLASPYISGTVHTIDPKDVSKVSLQVRTGYELRAFQFTRVPKKEDPKAKLDPPVKDKKDEAKDKKEEQAKDKKEQPKDKKEEAKEKVKEEDKTTWDDTTNPKIPEFQVDPDKVGRFVNDIAKLHTERFVSLMGDKKAEYKLTPDKSTVKIDLELKGGKTVTLIVGSRYQDHGYFATSSAWPDTVFFVSGMLVEPLLQGAERFAKERTAD